MQLTYHQTVYMVVKVHSIKLILFHSDDFSLTRGQRGTDLVVWKGVFCVIPLAMIWTGVRHRSWSYVQPCRHDIFVHARTHIWLRPISAKSCCWQLIHQRRSRCHTVTSSQIGFLLLGAKDSYIIGLHFGASICCVQSVSRHSTVTQENAWGGVASACTQLKS
jgi:hypothetical protein